MKRRNLIKGAGLASLSAIAVEPASAGAEPSLTVDATIPEDSSVSVTIEEYSGSDSTEPMNTETFELQPDKTEYAIQSVSRTLDNYYEIVVDIGAFTTQSPQVSFPTVAANISSVLPWRGPGTSFKTTGRPDEFVGQPNEIPEDERDISEEIEVSVWE